MASSPASSPETSFSLEGRGLKLDTEADIAPHIGPLTTHAGTIQTLALQGNTLGVAASAVLSPHLSKLASLHAANLADIFTSRLLSEIPPALSSLLTSLLPLQHLHTVNLSDNAFGLNTAAPLVAFLAAHTPLRHLVLNNNGLGPDAGAQVATALSALAAAQAREQRGGLETIVCGRNRLENGSMVAWAGAVAAHGGSLREVRMVQNGIRAEGVAVLLREGLGKVQGLRVLDLQDNTFTASAAGVLAEVVGGWGDVREVGVGDCLLSARGFIKLVAALSKGHNPQLEVLRCQYDEIDSRGVAALADMLEARDGKTSPLPRLRRVELNGNKFAEEDPAVDRLREALEAQHEAAGADGQEGVYAEWGLDDLSDLEDESAAEEDEDEEEDEGDEDEKDEPGGGDAETEKKGEALLKQADEAENENVAQEKDAAVDALADKLGKTEL